MTFKLYISQERLNLCCDRKQPENIRKKMYFLLRKSAIVEQDIQFHRVLRDPDDKAFPPIKSQSSWCGEGVCWPEPATWFISEQQFPETSKGNEVFVSWDNAYHHFSLVFTIANLADVPQYSCERKFRSENAGLEEYLLFSFHKQ